MKSLCGKPTKTTDGTCRIQSSPYLRSGNCHHHAEEHEIPLLEEGRENELKRIYGADYEAHKAAVAAHEERLRQMVIRREEMTARMRQEMNERLTV